jgi:hypothetical protein
MHVAQTPYSHLLFLKEEECPKKKGSLFSSGASVAGTRTRVARVRAEYPNHLDYNGFV